jgi:hypothetical protein
MPTQYRFVLFGQPRGPWRSRRRAALRDAIDAGEAEYDEVRRQHFTNAGAEIIWREIDQEDADAAD